MNPSMKASVYRAYGPPEVISIEDVALPTLQSGELLVRNYASTVSAAECAARRGRGLARLYFGITKPKWPILGSVLAGVVEAVGDGVVRFSVGDRVAGLTGTDFAATAQYVRVAQDAAIVAHPDPLSWAEAAALFDGALTALPYLRDTGKLSAGQTVLINGASGAVGSAAVQLAKLYGAIVTAVCSTRNIGLVQRLGADVAIDYTQEDFTAADKSYDIVFDAIGKSSFSKARRVVRPGGYYLTTVPSAAILMQMAWTSRFSGRKARIALTGLRTPAAMRADLQFLARLAAAGDYVPLIDECFPLEKVREAHRYVDTERKRGSVVITINGHE